MFALDRSGNRIDVFKVFRATELLATTSPSSGFALPLDIIVNDNANGVTDLNPLRFTKLNFQGDRLPLRDVPKEMPNSYLEVHTFTVDSTGILYGSDDQVQSRAEVDAKAGANPKLLIKAPWRAR